MSEDENHATGSSPGKRPARQSQWKVAAERIESLTRPAVLRYGKLEKDDIDSIIRDSIRGDIEEDDVLYRKGVQKIKTNVSTWKNRTIECIKRYVEAAVQKDKLKLMGSVQDPAKLFDAFSVIYDHHDAELAFPWAAKSVKFYQPSKGNKMARGPYWIKAYFINLAVKMKLHLDNIDNPRPGGPDRQSVLDFYDSFPMNPKYAMIEPKHFKRKPVRVKRTKDKIARKEAEEFGTLEDEINLSSSADDGEGADD